MLVEEPVGVPSAAAMEVRSGDMKDEAERLLSASELLVIRHGRLLAAVEEDDEQGSKQVRCMCDDPDGVRPIPTHVGETGVMGKS